jgi:cysteine dioxygenase
VAPVDPVPQRSTPAVSLPQVDPAAMPAALRHLFERLDAYSAPVPLEALSTLLDTLDLDVSCLAPWRVFDDGCYCRNLIHRGPGYEALLICWKPGQRSPIHDHRGSACAFRVLEGVVTETLYEPTRGDLACPVAMRWLPPGMVCATEDLDIHDVGNFERTAELVTLHIYSPPIDGMRLFRPDPDAMACFGPATAC